MRYEITLHDRESGETQQSGAEAYVISMIGAPRPVWRGWYDIPDEHSAKLVGNTHSLVDEYKEIRMQIKVREGKTYVSAPVVDKDGKWHTIEVMEDADGNVTAAIDGERF